ncbi:MAG: dolichyl-phosphate mannose synthase [Halobacteriovorax sp.]|nr:dolichyl-phosphate mannose synthase [Halobacteriovorax sp.]|tara:strand:+ start:32291 stop:33058 length:768 start_codon:yes stop_codon:yes gene_type:complete
MTSLLAIPCYNCEEQIVRVINSLKESTDLAVDMIIFVNNCSSDKTAEKIISSTASLKIPSALINNLSNYGLGGSFKLSFQYALENNFEHLIFFHGDDQAKVADVKEMIRQMKSDSSLTALLGSRFDIKSKRKGYSLLRTAGNKFLNLIFSIFCFRKITEIGSGLNIYRVDMLNSFNIDHWPNHIAFDVNIVLGLVSKNLKFKFFPITWEEEDQKSNAGNFSTALLVLFMLVKWRLGFKNTSLQWKREFKYDKVIL